MLPDMKHLAYHKDNHQSQQKEDRTAQSTGDRQPSAAFFSPCSDGCMAFPYRHGSKITSFPSDFRIMVTFSPS